MDEFTKAILEIVKTGGNYGLVAVVIIKLFAFLTNVFWGCIILGVVKAISNMFVLEAGE